MLDGACVIVVVLLAEAGDTGKQATRRLARRLTNNASRRKHDEMHGTATTAKRNMKLRTGRLDFSQ